MLKEEELRLAAEKGDKNVVQSLLAEGVYINSINADGETALDKACFRGQTEVALILIENGANVQTRDKLGYTPLMGATRGGHKSLVKALISKGAKVNATNMYGDTALHKASLCGNNEEIATILIENGAIVNSANYKGGTPLHEAALNKRETIIQILLQNGADVKIKDQDGQSALDIAIEYGYEDCINALQNTKRKIVKPKENIRQRSTEEQNGTQSETLIMELVESNTSLIKELNEIKLELKDKQTQIRRLEDKVQELTNRNDELKLLSLRSQGLSHQIDNHATQNISHYEPKTKSVPSKKPQRTQVFQHSEPREIEDTLEILGIEIRPNENLHFIVSSFERVLGLYFMEHHISSVNRTFNLTRKSPTNLWSATSTASNGSTVIEVKFLRVEFVRMWLDAYEKQGSKGIPARTLDWSFGDELVSLRKKMATRVSEISSWDVPARR